MKNTHILPTEKPIRLIKIYNDTNKDNFTFKLDLEVNDCYKEYQNIYITNNEEIKEGDWVYCIERKLFGKVVEIQLVKHILDSSMLYFKIEDKEIWCKLSNCKKIILTTDQDLIADGVQAIDDDFLEWFVKNPSCEFVKVEVDLSKHNGQFQTKYGYKIIIPKEEPNPFELPKAYLTMYSMNH